MFSDKRYERELLATIADIERVGRTGIVITNMTRERAKIAITAGDATGYHVTVTDNATTLLGERITWGDYVRVSIASNPSNADHAPFWREFERLVEDQPQ